MSGIVLADTMEIPFTAASFTGFRRWSRSRRFPVIGRIDYLTGHLEVDMSPEQFFSHGGVKAEVVRVLGALNYEQRFGLLRIDRTRVVHPQAELSVEPDVVLIAYASLQSGRVKVLASADSTDGDGAEIEGSPDLIVEIVSRSSLKKDTERLPKAYFRAGVAEYWLIDALGATPNLAIHQRGRGGFKRVSVDRSGFSWSETLQRRFRLIRRLSPAGLIEYELESAAD